MGVGEAAPLPGRSPEGIPAVEEALAGLPPLTLEAGAPFPPQLEACLALLEGAPASARFALEAALVDLAGQARGVPGWALFRDTPPAPLALNALIERPCAPEALAEAQAAVEAGAHTLKLKLGLRPFEEELAAVLALRAALGPELRLRLDPNCAWTLAEARPRLAALAAASPEYVEQPVPPGALEALLDPPAPLAADESLERPGADPEALKNCAVAVLKPTLVGGLVQTLRLAQRARAAGQGVVITHAREGAVAQRACALVAFLLPEPRQAMGLAPPDQVGNSGTEAYMLSPWTGVGLGLHMRK